MTTAVEVSANSAPGPAQRSARGAGQGGVGSIILQLVIAFGWFGADKWTPEQTAAVTGALIVAIGFAHNAVNHFAGERRRIPDAVTVEAVDPAKTDP